MGFRVFWKRASESERERERRIDPSGLMSDGYARMGDRDREMLGIEKMYRLSKYAQALTSCLFWFRVLLCWLELLACFFGG